MQFSHSGTLPALLTRKVFRNHLVGSPVSGSSFKADRHEHLHYKGSAFLGGAQPIAPTDPVQTLQPGSNSVRWFQSRYTGAVTNKTMPEQNSVYDVTES